MQLGVRQTVSTVLLQGVVTLQGTVWLQGVVLLQGAQGTGVVAADLVELCTPSPALRATMINNVTTKLTPAVHTSN